MPYIKEIYRENYKDAISCINIIPTKGELEFLIYTMMVIYMSDKEERYSDLHDTVYAAQHCADEFRRRRLDKREDSAREDNGDITNG